MRPTAVNADAGRARVHLAFRRDLPFSYESWSRVRLSDVEKWTFLGRAAVIPTAPVLCGRVAIGGQVTSIIGRNDAKVSVRPPASPIDDSLTDAFYTPPEPWRSIPAERRCRKRRRTAVIWGQRSPDRYVVYAAKGR